jgi:glycosyltransferase involved in cell wall biosynthesis
MASRLICHLTSVHSRDDVRIFHKECRSLIGKGYRVILIVSDGKSDKVREGIQIIGLAKFSNRLLRMFFSPLMIFLRSLRVNADLYHLHDPELIPIGLLLKLFGKMVIFDSHEDVSKQILGKPYLGETSRFFLSRSYLVFESIVCRWFDAIIAATPYIRDKFLKINSNTLEVNNFPILGELFEGIPSWSKRKKQVCYIGNIAKIRGIEEDILSTAFFKNDITLCIAGRFTDSVFEKQAKSLSQWNSIRALDWLSREEVKQLLNESMAGLVTLHPRENFLDSLPVKMFEYMSAGIPVIASDFPMWRAIIEKNQCGICVDPMNPQQIADAVNTLVENTELAETMGKNGRDAVLREFNWSIEEQKLFYIYERVLNRRNL